MIRCFRKVKYQNICFQPKWIQNEFTIQRCMHMCRRFIIALKYALTSLVNLSDPLVTGVLAYLWKSERWVESVHFKPFKDTVFSIIEMRASATHTLIISTSLGRHLYPQRLWFIGGSTLFLLWKPSSLWLLLFIHKQSDWITQDHPMRPQHSIF